MINPGDYTLASLGITAALSAAIQTSIQDLQGMKAVTLEAQFGYVSGGTSCKAWVQTTLDNGQTWVDIANFSFATASAVKIINLSGLTPVTTQVTPTDGAMADNTCQDGVLGSALRLKITSVGVYGSGTFLAVRASCR